MNIWKMKRKKNGRKKIQLKSDFRLHVVCNYAFDIWNDDENELKQK